MSKEKILIIEDESIVALNIQDVLKAKGYEICELGASFEEALAHTEKYKPDLIVMDILLNGEKDGIEAVEEIKKYYPIPIIYITAHTDEKTLERAKKTEPNGFISKPLSDHEILASVEIAIYKHMMERKLKESETNLKRAEEIGNIGHWEYDIDNNSISWSEQVYKIYQRDPKLGPPTYEEEAAYYSDKVNSMLKNNAQEVCVTGEALKGYTFPVHLPDGQDVYLKASMLPVKDETGRTIKLFGTVQDITEQKNILLNKTRTDKNLEALWHLTTIQSEPIMKVADYILNEIIRLTDSQYGFYGFMNEDESTMLLHAWSGKAMTDCTMKDKPLHFTIDKAGIWADAVRKRKPVIINSYESDFEGKIGIPEGHVKLKKLVSVPVFQEGKIAAIAAVANRSVDYTDEVVEEMVAFLRNAQLVIDNIKVKDQVKESLIKAEKKEREFSKLYNAACSILQFHNFNESASIIFDDCRELIGAQAGYVALLDESGEYNEVLYLNQGCYECTVDPDLPMPVRGMRAESYQTQRPVYDNDFQNSKHLKFIPDGHVKLENVLFIPLLEKGKAVGLIGLSNKPGGFNNDDMILASAFAEIASISLINSKMHENLTSSLNEKETLLAEIHHRVKNNMQIILSMFSLQFSKLENEEVQKHFSIFENRIKAMALVHEKLYSSENMTSIDFGDYLKNLVMHIYISNAKSTNEIEPKIKVKNMFLTIDKAIPCGLIVTELVSNGLKHAFPRGKQGEIEINLKKRKDRDYILTVKDNGKGLNDNVNLKDAESMGFNIVNALVKQIKGKIEFTGKKGTRITITFPV